MRVLISIFVVVTVLSSCGESPSDRDIESTLTSTISETPTWTEHQAINIVLTHILRGSPIQYEIEEPIPSKEYCSQFIGSDEVTWEIDGDVHTLDIEVFTGEYIECLEEAYEAKGRPTESAIWNEAEKCPEWEPQHRGYVAWNATYLPAKSREEKIVEFSDVWMSLEGLSKDNFETEAELIDEFTKWEASKEVKLLGDSPGHWQVVGFGDGCAWGVTEDSLIIYVHKKSI